MWPRDMRIVRERGLRLDLRLHICGQSLLIHNCISDSVHSVTTMIIDDGAKVCAWKIIVGREIGEYTQNVRVLHRIVYHPRRPFFHQ